jgi:hypothetical protein
MPSTPKLKEGFSTVQEKFGFDISENEHSYFLGTGGVSYALFISLLISKLFCTRGCMGGGEGGREGEPPS